MPRIQFEMSTRIYGQWWNVIKQTVKRLSANGASLSNTATTTSAASSHLRQLSARVSVFHQHCNNQNELRGKAAAGGIPWKLRVTQCFRLTFMIKTDLRYAGRKRFHPICLGDWQENKKKCSINTDICQPSILWNPLSPRFTDPENALVVHKNASQRTLWHQRKCQNSFVMSLGRWRECGERTKWWKNYRNTAEGTLLLYGNIYWRPQGSKLLSKLSIYICIKKKKKITAIIILAYVLSQLDWNNIIAVKNP